MIPSLRLSWVCVTMQAVHGASGLFGPHHHKHSCKGSTGTCFCSTCSVIYTKPCRRPLRQSSNGCSTVAALRFKELHFQGDTVLHPSGSTQKKGGSSFQETIPQNLGNKSLKCTYSIESSADILKPRINVLQRVFSQGPN